MAFLFIVPDFRGIVNILPKVCRICGDGNGSLRTFPPNLAFKKGSVTAAAAAYNPSGGFLLCII